MAMIPITGFSPGIDPTTPGAIIDCVNMLPTIAGMEASGNGESLGFGAVTGTILNTFNARLLDGSARVFAATATAIYELSGGVWVDRSRVGGYATGTGETWNFCQFGDVTIATNYSDEVQASTGSGDFVDLAGSPPKARLCDSANGFVMLFDYNDGVNIFHDGWWASGLYDHTQWTPSAATQSANGRLFDTPGKISAGRRLGSSFVAYKDNSMFLGQYVGPDKIWAWTQITDNTGAFGHNSVVQNEGSHIFIGNNGIFSYDGSRPVPIGAVEVKLWLKNNINQQYRANVVSGIDTKKSNVYLFYPSNSSTGTVDEALVYNVITGKFGRATKSIISINDIVLPSINWLELGDLYATWGGWPSTVTWGSPLFYGAGIGLVYVGSDGVFYKVDSTAGTSSITYGDVGDDTYYSTIRRVRPRFLKSPASAQHAHWFKTGEGEALQTGVISDMDDNKFDLLKSARFHRGQITMTGDCEITAIDIDLKTNGTR